MSERFRRDAPTEQQPADRLPRERWYVTVTYFLETMQLDRIDVERRSEIPDTVRTLRERHAGRRDFDLRVWHVDVNGFERELRDDHVVHGERAVELMQASREQMAEGRARGLRVQIR